MRELKGDWRDLFNGFSVALDIKKMFAVFIAMALTAVVVLVIPLVTVHLLQPGIVSDQKLCDFRFSTCHQSLIQMDFDAFKETMKTNWHNFKACVNHWRYALNATMGGWKYPYLVALWLLVGAIWAYFGGLVTRIAAINLTKDDALGLGKAGAFASKKFMGFFTPWVICVLGFAFFALCNVFGGFIGRIPFAGEILVALGLPMAILSGFIMAFIAVGYLFSSIMFLPTIGVESTDSFDAISRSFQYLYAKPWHYIWYVLVAIAYGIPCILFVRLFGGAMIMLGLKTAAWGMGTKFTDILTLTNLPMPCFDTSVMTGPVPVTYNIAAIIIGIWLILITGLIVSYAISYSLSANTIIYLLLRKKVDEIEMAEVYEEETTEEAGFPSVTTTPAPSGTTEPPAADKGATT